MKPRIDIDITDCYGDSVDKLLDANGFEPYEIYLNGSKVCMDEKLNELESNNEKLKELKSNNEKLKNLLLRCWFAMLSEREALQILESSVDSTYVNTLDMAITDIKNDILNSGMITNDELK